MENTIKNVVVTGASKGIGKAIAEVFAAEGAHLFLCARNEIALYKTVEHLQTTYPQSVIRAKGVDLSIQTQAQNFAQWILQSCTPDILVNNAGNFTPGNIYDEPDGALEAQLGANLFSAYYLTRALLPSMISQKSGHIFNLCSIASLQAYKQGGSYSISKFALSGFSKNLREELKAFGIKVTGIYPGAVFTDSWGDFDNSEHRIMEAADIAQLVKSATGLSAAAVIEDIVIRPQLGDL